MIERKAPMAEANRLSAMLTQILGAERFPVDVEALALEYSAKCFPESPITKIVGDDLPGFEGMLNPNKGRTKWLITYNNSRRSPGRIRFTLAHEFGHYLLHRKLREQFSCSELDMHDWDSEDRAIESEADIFASFLLMPLDDFRRQLHTDPISFEILSHCASRYGVSLTAAALKWIEIAPRRAILVVSRDDHLLWARSNRAAFLSGAVLPTRKRTIGVPAASAAHSRNYQTQQNVLSNRAQIWFPREPSDMPITEMMFVSDQYDYTLTLLLMPDAEGRFADRDEADELLVPLNRLMRDS